MNSRNLNNKKICYKKGLIAVAHFLQNRKQGHSYYHTLVLFVLISPTCLPLNNAKNGHPSYRELMVGKKEPKNFSNLFLQIHHIFFFFIAVIVLVGTKSDLESKRMVPKEVAEEFANSKNIRYIEVSAKTGANVEELFRWSTEKVFRNLA